VRPAQSRRALAIEELECRRCPSAAPGLLAAAISLPTDPNAGLTGNLSSAGSTELYHVPVDADGLLTAQVHPLGFSTRLSVLDGQGNILIQSEASSAQDPDDHVTLHVTPGDYFLMVQGLSGGGSFQLGTSFTDAEPPSQLLTSGTGSYSVAVADLNGDHIPDVVISDFYGSQVLVDLGVGDGTFQPPIAIPVGLNPLFVTTADLTGNGIQDIITANLGSNDVSILMGNGDGTFRPAIEVPAGLGPASVAVGDFTGNGKLDLAVADLNGNSVQILMGNGDGTFTQGASIPVAGGPISVTSADFNADGTPDLAVASFNGGTLTILRGQGDGTFAPVQTLATGWLPTSVIAADLDGDGQPDLAVASAGANTVQVYQDQGGLFVPSTVLQTPTSPYSLVAADFNGDGRLDLAASSYGAGDISIFLNEGGGNYRAEAPIPVGASTTGLVAAALSGDGRVDLVTADLITTDVYVLMGEGDGEFQAPPPPTITTASPTVVAADLTGNGIEDLIVPDYSGNDISILLGRGDGTFRAPILVPTGLGPWGIAVGDFTGSGILDLAVTDRIEDSVVILLGNGDGTFRLGQNLQTGVQASYITAADLDGDGHLDLVESDYISGTLSIFYGNGNGTFRNAVTIPVGSQPGNPVVGDFDGDGRLGIAVPVDQDEVAVLLPTGPRTYAPAQFYAAGPGANLLAVGDLTGNGIPDLVVSDAYSSDPAYVTVLLGNGDGTFRFGSRVNVGAAPFSITLADLNGNGKLDIITTDQANDDVSVVMGNGDGTFQAPIELPAGSVPYGVAVADLNGDGRPDIAVADYDSGSVTVLLNRGGGVFGPPESIPVGATQVAMVSAEFTDNGRVDLAIANPTQDTVTILLGNGDGTFTNGQTISVGIDPSGLVAADFNGDGNVDLAVACAGSNDVMVLFGMGDGWFSSPITLPVGELPHAIVAGDFFDDGHIDIAVADEGSGDVAVLRGRGDGSFLPARFYPVGAEPVALVAADLDGDGDEELVTANRTSGDLTILWSQPNGGFSAQTLAYGGHAPSALTAADFNGDGRDDIAVADEQDDEVTVLLSLGDGTFATPMSVDIGQGADYLLAVRSAADDGKSLGLAAIGPGSQSGVIVSVAGDGVPGDQILGIPLGVAPIGAVVADFTGDGLNDVAMVTASSMQVVVRLGTLGGQLLAPPDPAPLPQPAPVVVDWNGGGTPDVFTLDQQGRLLLRPGQPGVPGEFEAAQVIGASTGASFRDIVLVQTRYGVELAALDANQPVVWPIGHAPGPGAGFEFQSIAVPGASILVSIASGDLDGDGLDDLVLVDRGKDQLIVLDQQPDGSFREVQPPLSVSGSPSEVAIDDLNGDGRPDLVVSDTYSGELSVFYGRPAGFGPEVRLAGGLGVAEAVAQGDGAIRQSDDQPMGVAAGVFDASGLTDVVSVQSGADRISLLDGTPGGGLADPSLATSYPTGIDPTQVVAAPLTGDGLTDLIVLDQGSDEISIFLNNGKGGFTAMPSVDAGNDPTGLAVRDVNGDGVPDLLVGNAQGDLLIILGNGDGTFRPYERADQGVSLALGDFGGNGQTGYVLSNTSIDQLSLQYGETQSFVQGRSQGLQAPGAVAVADLNGDGNLDIIVLNQGENDMLVYLGLGGNRFAAPLRFFTGTDPVGLTVADVTGDGIPDIIVANAGSDDLSVFIGVGSGPDWTLQPRPRLRVGNDPVSTTVADVYGDGISDIISVDRGSDDVEVLRGVGDGFFDDQDPLVLPAGPAPIRAFVGKFAAGPGPDLAVLDSASSDLTYYSDFTAASAIPQLIPTGGPGPVAGVMGAYLDDGYDDLFIAHQGDSRITLLEGSPIGLTLAGSLDVGPSVQPTDLAISTDESGALQIYVAASGLDQAILVHFTPGDGSASVGPSTSSPLPPAVSPTQGTETRGAPRPATTGPMLLDDQTMEGGAQVQASTQSEAAPAAPAVGSAPATVATIGVGAILPQIINPSLAPLTFLVSNLVQLGQVQVSDLMPLDHSDLDAVAVLIVVSGVSGEDPIVAEAGPPEEAAADALDGLVPSSPVASMKAVPSRPGASNLERFLLDLDGASGRLPREILGDAAPPAGPRRGWAWDAEETGTPAAHGPRRPMPRVAIPDLRPEPDAGAERDPGPEDAAPVLPALEGETFRFAASPTAGTDAFDGARPLGGALFVSSLLFGGWAAWKRTIAGHSRSASRRTSPAVSARHTASRLLASRTLGSRAGRGDDLPPWLAPPPSTRWPSKG
jgi:hypothetical protein